MNQLLEIQGYIPEDIYEMIKQEHHDICYLMDLKTDEYIYISPTEQLLGYPTEEFYRGGSDFTISLIYREDYQRVLLHFATTLESAFGSRTVVKGIKFRMLRNDGKLIWVNRTLIIYQENKQQRVLGLVQETTQEPDKEQILIEQIDKSPYLVKNLSSAVEELNEKYESEKLRICKSITDPELTILKLISQDLNNKMIASSLSVSVRTVETHRKNLHKKLEVHSAAGLMAKAGKLGLIGRG